MVFRLAARSIGFVALTDTRIALDADAKYLVNPGSVGQPRDSDPRAAYAIFDAGTRQLEMYRLDYPIAQTQQKMVTAGLPEPLVRRLAAGR